MTVLTTKINNTTITMDPLDHYKKDSAVFEACGLLFEWVWEGASADIAPSRALEESYNYFMGWEEQHPGNVVDQKFTFPGDEPLAPLLRAVRGDEAVFIYPHAIVAVVQGNKVKWTRMD